MDLWASRFTSLTQRPYRIKYQKFMMFLNVLGCSMLLAVLCCGSGVAAPALYPDHYVVKIADDSYEVIDARNKRLYAKGWLDTTWGETRLRLDFSTKLVDFGPAGQLVITRSNDLRGKAEFENILSHFDKKIKGIQGYWEDGDNLSKFNKLYEYGVPAVLAAAETWTGKMALKHGFTQIKVRRIDLQFVRQFRPAVVVDFDRPAHGETATCNSLLENLDLTIQLLLATAKGDRYAVEVLLKAGANPNPVMTEENRIEAPLLIAAREGHLEVAKLLVEAGANLGTHSRAFRGFRALDCARNAGHASVFEYLKSVESMKLPRE